VYHGAQIEFISPRLQYNGNNEDNAPAIHEAGLLLDASGEKQDVLNAAESRGAGTSSVVWGDQAALDAQLAEGAEVIENEPTGGISTSGPSGSVGSTTVLSSSFGTKMTCPSVSTPLTSSANAEAPPAKIVVVSAAIVAKRIIFIS